MQSQVQLIQIINKIDRLPELPQVALKLTQLLDDPDVSAEKLADVIRVDASFTSQVLKLCNSAAYGLSRTISTVKEAVAILGFKVLKSMVYTIIAKITLDKPIDGYSLDKGALWKNALTCAVYAKHIAKRERFADPELAFTAALLRDLGKIVLGEFVGANYAQIEQKAMDEKIDFVQAEEKVLGISHTTVGAKIGEKWNLPAQLISVMKYHHKPVNLPPNLDAQLAKLILIVHLADSFTMLIGSGIGNDGLMYTLDIDALGKAGFKTDEESLELLMSELMEQNRIIKELEESLKAFGN
ncbi:MAG: HDOD domain-containing protein [Vampirovibrionales bacterium]|nr:HDOD domain-containing protein [Vampirovibrionales bacterium]